MISELARHGYRISPGTLYPMLHTMERDGYLSSRVKSMGRTRRRFYRITRKGRSALKLAQTHLRELIHEVD